MIVTVLAIIGALTGCVALILSAAAYSAATAEEDRAVSYPENSPEARTLAEQGWRSVPLASWSGSLFVPDTEEGREVAELFADAYGPGSTTKSPPAAFETFDALKPEDVGDLARDAVDGLLGRTGPAYKRSNEEWICVYDGQKWPCDQELKNRANAGGRIGPLHHRPKLVRPQRRVLGPIPEAGETRQVYLTDAKGNVVHDAPEVSRAVVCDRYADDEVHSGCASCGQSRGAHQS